MNFFNLSCCLPARVEFLGALSHCARMAERLSLPKTSWADRQPQALEVLACLFLLAAHRRDAVQDGGQLGMPCDPHKVERRRHGVEIEYGGPAGNQDELCVLSCSQGGLFGARRRVDQYELGA